MSSYKDIAYSFVNSRGSLMSNHPGPFILESISKSSKLKYEDITVYNILPSQNFTKYMKKVHNEHEFY